MGSNRVFYMRQLVAKLFLLNTLCSKGMRAKGIISDFLEACLLKATLCLCYNTFDSWISGGPTNEDASDGYTDGESL